MIKEDIISEYKRVKKLLGHQPSKPEFYNHSSIKEYWLYKFFDRRAFSKLAEECGDIPNVFSIEKSNLENILKQYGELVRKLGQVPVNVEWDNAKLKPRVSSIYKVHKLTWSKLPNKFLEFAQGKSEWNDVVNLIPNNNPIEKKIEDSNTGMCYVYLMIDTKTNLHKIGISNIAEYREKTLQSEKPSIKLIAKKRFVNRRMAASFEKALHETYSHKRKRGEWFLLNDGDLSELKETLNN